MTFELLPIFDLMYALYQQPVTQERFKAYLSLLQGDIKGDMVLPIGSFNPMAKEHILAKMEELRALEVEKVMQQTLDTLNKKINPTIKSDTVFRVVFNLADDLKGGWTNRYTTDYDSKFRINALQQRCFCVPVFWSSEVYSESLIVARTQEYAHRSIYWQENPKPKTLAEHITQEQFAYQNTGFSAFQNLDFSAEQLASDSYHLIFQALYGSSAAELLGFPTR